MPDAPDEKKLPLGGAGSDAGGADDGLLLNQADLDALFSVAMKPADYITPEPSPPANLSTSGDALLPGSRSLHEQVGDTGSMDAQLAGGLDDAILLTQDNVDSLLSELEVDAPLAPVPAPPTDDLAAVSPTLAPPKPPVGSEEISDDLLAALLNAAETASTATDVGMENLVAAATAPVETSVDLKPVPAPAAAAPSPVPSPATDSAAQRPSLSPETVVPFDASDEAELNGAPPAPSAKSLRRRFAGESSVTREWLSAYGARIAASILAGLLGGATTFSLLRANLEQRPTFADLGVQQMMDLDAAMERAREMAGDGQYESVRELLERPVAAAEDSALRTEAEFLLLKSEILTLDDSIASPRYGELQQSIDQMVSAHPEDPHAPELLRLKARLLEQQELPTASYDALKALLDRYPEAEGTDGTLLDTAKLGLELNRIPEATAYLQQLLSQFPGSKRTGEARLLLGDTYLRAGMEEDAELLFERVAANDPDPQARAEGILKLGHMALEAGDFAGAEKRLKDYLARTVSLDGNDEVNLQLAKVERSQNKLTAARDTLTDLINFFPPSEVTPAAYVELTEVTDALGEREEALKIAQDAAAKYPADPAVLRNKGTMLGLTGRAKAAAETLLAANQAGAFDPEMLLTAARHLRTAGMYPDSLRAYRQLQEEYGGLPAAIDGGIEMAQLNFTRGNVREAVAGLQALEVATAASPQHLDVLLAQRELYHDLGWKDDLATVSRQIATSATEDEVLAQATIGLLEADDSDEAREIYKRIDLAQLRAPTAYDLVWTLGEKLLEKAPREGLELMEQAYLAHPSLRTREQEKTLLRSYIAANRPAAARRVVMELAAQAQSKPTDNIHLIEAAIAWGDYLYGRNDYRTAADAYGMAEEAAKSLPAPPSTPGQDPRWAQYQRANALLQLRDYQAGLRLLDEIAASGAPWAREAEAKANFTRMEQRLSSSSRASG